jgi:hypothetical protein
MQIQLGRYTCTISNPFTNFTHAIILSFNFILCTKKNFDLILQSWYNLYFLKLYNSLDLFCLYIYLAKFTDLKQQSVLKILFFWAMFYANIDHMFHLLIIFMQILIIFSNYITLLSIPDAWNWLNPVIVCITLDSTLNHAVSQKKKILV